MFSLDLPHVRMCQKLIDVVRLVPTCMRRLVVELAWFGTVEGLLMQQIWANDNASRKPLQGWFRMSDLEIRMRGILPGRAKRPSKSPIKSTEFYLRQAALDQAVVPLTKDKFKIGRWGADGVSLKWCTHLLMISCFVCCHEKGVAETVPQSET